MFDLEKIQYFQSFLERKTKELELLDCPELSQSLRSLVIQMWKTSIEVDTLEISASKYHYMFKELEYLATKNVKLERQIHNLDRKIRVFEGLLIGKLNRNKHFTVTEVINQKLKNNDLHKKLSKNLKALKSTLVNIKAVYKSISEKPSEDLSADYDSLKENITLSKSFLKKQLTPQNYLELLKAKKLITENNFRVKYLNYKKHYLHYLEKLQAQTSSLEALQDCINTKRQENCT